MQPLRGWHFNTPFFSQGGASLTLGFVMEPLRGSLVFCYLIAYKTADFRWEPLRGSPPKPGGVVPQGGAFPGDGASLILP
jgi:hypothetical protein